MLTLREAVDLESNPPVPWILLIAKLCNLICRRLSGNTPWHDSVLIVVRSPSPPQIDWRSAAELRSV